MSLINIAESVNRSRTLTRTRTLLTLLAVTSAVILGLLAMHSLSSAHGHDPATVAHTALMDTGHGAAHADGHEAAAATECADCGGGHADMLAMACILALMALTVLLSPRVGHLLGLLRGRAPTVARAWVRGHVPPTPSLSVLCISRT
ncbi:DUF6153 family protein [Microbacterium sp. NPDC006705]|uniref:DUF6153 family protein n=1 Tax=Microbacterium TaxID=33882 RepID=UPI002B45AB49|nr:DUF6153 family protein [Microbacterium plantarum]WRK17136.1 DUF6153 family protein [Microbacterium plantarum]